MYFTKVLGGRQISAAEAYQRATPAQRAEWFPQAPPGPGGKGWDYGDPRPDPFAGPPPADPAELLESLGRLQELEASAEVLWLGALLDYELAGLKAAELRAPRPDPTAPRPLSEAERRHRAAADAALIASWRQ
jgi:hypothetical protein